jgi:hypothetical protein
MEIWKQIQNFPLYEVSTLGRVKRIETGKILKLVRKGGYNKIQLFDNGMQKRPAVHRLVAKAFIENPENKPDIHHIDHDKGNNCVDNLMWVTSQENNSYNIHNFNRVLSHCPIKIACVDYIEVKGILFRTLTSASLMLKMSRGVIKMLIKANFKGYQYHPPKFY